MKFFSRNSDPSKKLDKQTRKNTAANSRPKPSSTTSLNSEISQAETLTSNSTRSVPSRTSTKSSTATCDPYKKDKAKKHKHVDDALAEAYHQANAYHSAPVFWSWS